MTQQELKDFYDNLELNCHFDQKYYNNLFKLTMFENKVAENQMSYDADSTSEKEAENAQLA